MAELVVKYRDYAKQKKAMLTEKHDKRLFENILLAHMMNLFNANLLTADETRKHIVWFREDI